MFDRLIARREQEAFSISSQFKLIRCATAFCASLRKPDVPAWFASGLESINPDSLLAAKKKQNRIAEYRDMLQTATRPFPAPAAAAG